MAILNRSPRQGSDPANHVWFSSAAHVYALVSSRVTAELVVNLCRGACELNGRPSRNAEDTSLATAARTAREKERARVPTL